MKLASNLFSLHHFILIGVILMGVFSSLFYFMQEYWVRGTLIFLASMGGAMLDILVNLSALRCFDRDHTSMWLQMIHGFFGIGGLVGPFAVYFFELKTMTVIGIASLICGVYFLYLESPIEKADEKEDINSHGLPIPQMSVYLMATAFFFTIGQETAFGGWVSSYAVLYNFSSK